MNHQPITDDTPTPQPPVEQECHTPDQQDNEPSPPPPDSLQQDSDYDLLCKFLEERVVSDGVEDIGDERLFR